MTPESYTLAPSLVVDKARRLADAGLYEQALELLQRNRVIFEIYPTHVDVRLASEKDQQKQRERFISSHRMVKTNKARYAQR